LKPHRINHYPQTLTVVYYVRGSMRAERESQHQNCSSPQSPAPLTSKKLSDRQKMTKLATSEAASRPASPPTAISDTAAPMSSSLAVAIAAMLESSFVLAKTATWPPLFSGFSPVTASGPTATPIPFGSKASSSLPATRASSALRVKVAIQGSNPSNTDPTRPESGDTGSVATAAKETTALEASVLLVDRTIKMPVSLTRRSKKCRFSNSEELASVIQEPLSKDVQEDRVDTAAIPSSATTDCHETIPESPPLCQEPASATSFNVPRPIGAFPEGDLDTHSQENKKTTSTPASTQEGHDLFQ
ncbi:hypothetical protein BG000_003857, partial [Podila horticola]